MPSIPKWFKTSILPDAGGLGPTIMQSSDCFLKSIKSTVALRGENSLLSLKFFFVHSSLCGNKPWQNLTTEGRSVVKFFLLMLIKTPRYPKQISLRPPGNKGYKPPAQDLLALSPSFDWLLKYLQSWKVQAGNARSRP